jgi:hypothetical protein
MNNISVVLFLYCFLSPSKSHCVFPCFVRPLLSGVVTGAAAYASRASEAIPRVYPCTWPGRECDGAGLVRTCPDHCHYNHRRAARSHKFSQRRVYGHPVTIVHCSLVTAVRTHCPATVAVVRSRCPGCDRPFYSYGARPIGIIPHPLHRHHHCQFHHCHCHRQLDDG